MPVYYEEHWTLCAPRSASALDKPVGQWLSNLRRPGALDDHPGWQGATARPRTRGVARGRDERQGSVAAGALRTVPLAGETTASLNRRVAARYGLPAARFIWFAYGRNNSSASEVLTSTALPDKPDLLLPVLEYGLLQKTPANRVVRTAWPQSPPCPASS
ncbi:helicase associated domain-containing protein [Streptomyces nodosus]|uniref:helicase associated domain-containing protein n=1 Tax=Streptomyces nodosus TaxID=40318 RepID=UPI0036E891B6